MYLPTLNEDGATEVAKHEDRHERHAGQHRPADGAVEQVEGDYNLQKEGIRLTAQCEGEALTGAWSENYHDAKTGRAPALGPALDHIVWA